MPCAKATTYSFTPQPAESASCSRRSSSCEAAASSRQRRAKRRPSSREAQAFEVAYDGVGQATFARSLAALRPRGMLVLYGAASGPVSPFDPMELERGGSLYLTRPSLRHYATPERAREVFDLIRAGKLDVRIGGRYRLADARKAHEDLQSRRTTGKLLLLS